MAGPRGVGLGLAPSPLLRVTDTPGDRVLSLQPEHAGRDASVQAAVEKLQEENRLLKHQVTHVSV